MNCQLDIEKAYRMFFEAYPDVLDVKQLSTILGVCQKTVLDLLAQKKINSFKIGRMYRIPKLYLIQYLGLMPEEK